MTTNASSYTRNTQNAAAQGADNGSESGKSTPKTDVTKNEFLQLLVAQLRNQDPMKPADGTQFLTQLAQFEQLEQSLNMGQDIAAIRTDLEQSVTTGAGSTQNS